jgi:signal transduction histidine kinase/CheY-like chemotaxis protein
MRIRSRLLLLVSAVLVPALAVAAVSLAYLYSEEQQFHRQNLQETARAMAYSLDREIARRESVLKTLAVSHALQTGNLENFHAHARRVADDGDTAIIVSDLQGRQLVNTRLPFGVPLPPMLEQERQMRARYGNEVTLVSDVYLPPSGLGPHSFAVQLPVRTGGKVVMFLTMASYARQLQALVSAQQLPAQWHASIIDRAGVVVARSVEPERFVGQPVRRELFNKIGTTTEGFHEGHTLAALPSTAFFSRAPQSGWVFLVAVPDAVLKGPARRATALAAAMTLLLLGLGLAASLYAARRIAVPIEALRLSAERMGRGEPVDAPHTGTLELDAVGQAMAQASGRLREAKEELESRVREAVHGYESSQRALVQSQKLEALGRLTGGIAHDFNNVLQTLTTGLQTLKLMIGPERRELVERCQRAVSRGTELARQLMAFGRVQEVRRSTIDTAERLIEARRLLGGALPTNIALEYDLMPGLWPVTVDPSQLELALLNLVINARDAMPAGGSLVLRGSNVPLAGGHPDLPAADYVVLTLSDTGEGMTPEVMAHALDPFYTTKGVGQGSGMGLPQAYGFARQNGGTLVLDSEPGQGTTVRLYLPRASGMPESAQLARTGPGLPRCKGKVLLVEDDVLVRETVQAGLQAAGFEIATADTADEALQRIDGGEVYDAILTDVVMPGALSGIDLAEHVVRRHPGIGVVVATGYSDRKVHLHGVRTLPKPYDLQQAVDALNAACAG